MIKDLIEKSELSKDNIIKCRKNIKQLRILICIITLTFAFMLFLSRDLKANNFIWQDYVIFLIIFAAQCLYVYIKNKWLFNSIKIITHKKEPITNEQFVSEQLHIIRDVKTKAEPLLEISARLVKLEVEQTELINIVNSNAIIIDGLIEYIK